MQGGCAFIIILSATLLTKLYIEHCRGVLKLYKKNDFHLVRFQSRMSISLAFLVD